MKASDIVKNGIYLNHDGKSERTITEIFPKDEEGQKEVYFLDHTTWKEGISTVKQMSEWVTKRIDVKRKTKGA